VLARECLQKDIEDGCEMSYSQSKGSPVPIIILELVKSFGPLNHNTGSRNEGKQTRADSIYSGRLLNFGSQIPCEMLRAQNNKHSAEVLPVPVVLDTPNGGLAIPSCVAAGGRLISLRGSAHRGTWGNSNFSPWS